MKTLALATLLLWSFHLLCASHIEESPSKVVNSAVDQVDIRKRNSRPFQMEVEFRAQFDLPKDGHLSLKWAAPDRWYQKVTISTFQETRVRNGENLWIKRNMRFTPLRVSEIEDLLRVLSFIPEQNVRPIKHEQQDRVTSNCVEIRDGRHFESRGSHRRICLDTDTNDVISDEQRDDSDLRLKKFTEYLPFGMHRFPKKLDFYVNGSPVIQATVVALEEASFDKFSFEPPSDAIQRPQCDHLMYPQAIRKPDPQYSRSVAASPVGGTSIVALTIEPDGSIDNIFVIETAGRERDEAVKEMLGHWRFQPAMCGDRAIPYDAHVEVNFPPAVTGALLSPRQQMARVSFHD